ncbi:MAG: hypothetical protein ACJ8GN_06740 [Longimicrobiaceae bacterium]
MRKLKLELDALEVETFGTRDAGAIGTVRAHDTEDPPPDTADPNAFSCNILSCGGTCWLTPNICGSCGCGESGFDPCG